MTEQRKDNWRLFGTVLLVQMALFSVSAFSQQFSLFRFWDDEGYVMITLRQFLQGKALYSQMYSQYGPGFFLFHKILSLVGMSLTHDALRILTMVTRLLIVALSGGGVFRMTHSLPAAALAGVLAFLTSVKIVDEPGHPQGLCLLIILASVLITARRDRKTPDVLTIALLGAAGGLLVLVKINLGIFFLAAVGLALAFSMVVDRGVTLTRIIFAGSGLLLPLALLRSFQPQQWALLLCAAVVAPLIAALLLLRPVSGALYPLPALSAVVLGLLACVLPVVGATLLGGTSLLDLLQGILLQHIGFENIFRMPPVFALPVLGMSFALLGCGVAMARNNTVVPWLMIGAAALTVVTVQFRADHLADSCIPALGLLAVSFRSGGIVPSFGRLFLLFLVPLEMLWVFPVAGSQRACVSVLAVMAAALLCHDGMALLGAKGARRFAGGLAAAVIVLHLYVAAMAWSDYRGYRSQTPLGLPGTTLLRLPDEQVRTLRGMSGFLATTCDTFVTDPGMYSLYFWSGKDTPLSMNATAWMTLLNNGQQQGLVEELRQLGGSKRLLLVQNADIASFWLQGRTLTASPLVEYLWQRFPRQVAQFGGYAVFAGGGEEVPAVVGEK